MAVKGQQRLTLFDEAPYGDAADVEVERNVVHHLTVVRRPIEPGLMGRRVKQTHGVKAFAASIWSLSKAASNAEGLFVSVMFGSAPDDINILANSACPNIPAIYRGV